MFEDQLQELLENEQQAYALLDLLDNEIFEKELIKFTEDAFRQTVNLYFVSEESKKKVMLGLTFIALKYYDGALWPHVCNEYNSIVDDKLLISQLRDNVLNFYTKKYNCDRKQYQIPVINSIVPFHYASSYIEFVNDIYVKNLDCDLASYDINEELNNVFNAIGKNKNLSDLDDTFKYNYDKEAKVYKLIKATKSIIRSGLNRDELILFTRDILKKLDNYYKGINLESSYYINESFKQWASNNEQLIERIKSNHVSHIKSKSAYFTYAKGSGKVYLHTPTKRLFGEYDPDKFRIEVLENEKVIDSKSNLRINYIMGGIEILEDVSEISRPLNRIKCLIYYNDEIVDDSKETLFRNYMIFNDERELKNNKIYNGLVYFIYKNTVDNRLTKLKDYTFYKTAYATVKENDEYVLDGNVISFSDNIKPGIIGEQIHELEIIKNGTFLPVFKKIEQICITSQNLNKLSNKFKINNSYVDISLAVDVIKQANVLAYVINFNKLNLPNGVFNIELMDIQHQKCQGSYEFLYDSNLNIEEMLISEYSLNIIYDGSFHMIDQGNTIYTRIKLPLNDLSRKKYFLRIGDNSFECKFNLTVPYYKISNTVYSFSHYLTSDDYDTQTRLFFNVKDCDKIRYIVDSDIINMKEFNIKIYDKKTYIDLSELFNYKNAKLIELSFLANGNEKQFLKIYNDAIFNRNESYYSVNSLSEEIEFKIVIDGLKSSDEFYIKLWTKNEIIDDKKLILNEPISFKLGNKITKVHYCIYRIIKVMDGFKLTTKQEIMHEERIAYYPFADLIKKYLVIDKVLLENTSEEDSNFYDVNKLNLRLVKRFSKFKYLGFLYTNKNGHMIPFNKINEVLVTLSQVYQVDGNYYCDANICLFYPDSLSDNAWIDYLQYNESEKTIVNGASKNAPYIVKYRINLTLGEKQYGIMVKSSRQSQLH